MKLLFTLFLLSIPSMAISITDLEREELKHEAKDMFNHAFGAYMANAWPADELMPLSCRGRYRGREPSRGDIDDALGNFSLTLIDSLDMLVVLGDLEEFEDGVNKVIKHVTFDQNIVVSVFETNIRIVGGLVSAHVLAELVRDRHNKMTWYRGELLNMAVDIGTRLLPAFNSTTGLPFPRVNLQSGLRGVAPVQMTCTACAGSMILEFAALSRLSGEPVFEEKASKAMDVLWASRHRQSNLVGNVLNVNTGDWIRRDSGVGAGIDSYYEYVAKAYVLLGDYKYLERWNTHYHAVMKYMGTGPLMMDVHMHRPHTNSKHFADSLGAFWPGLQVLMGDLKPAIEQHEVLYQIMQRHNFIPEAVTADFQIHWGQHLLRPEFVESTYFLYRATKDPHYLEVGKKILKALQKYSRVTCGYAAIKDVRTMQHEDRMDSFVLSETFKYLYLLFAKEEDLLLDMHQFVFTTEAHLLPLSLARLSNATAVPMDDYLYDTVIEDEDVEFAEACPSVHYLFPDHETNREAAASVREPLARVVEDSCPSQKIITRKLTASQFQTGNEEHMKLVKDMGITIISLPDGRVQLLHTFANAKSPDDAEEGLLFMQEMIELSKQQASQAESPPKLLTYFIDGVGAVLQAGPAQFGKELINGVKVTGEVVLANSLKACGGSLQNGPSMLGKIVVIERGDCMFVEKARVIQSLGAVGGIVLDNAEGTSAASSPLFAMSGDGTDDINIPLIFLFTEEARIFMKALHENLKLVVTLREKPEAEQSDFVKGPTAPNDELDDDDDAEIFKSPVHAFLSKNKNTDVQESDDPETILIQVDNDTGEIVSSKTQTIRGSDGSTRTIKTVEKLKNGEIKREKSVGEVKIVKVEEMLSIQDVDEDDYEKDAFDVKDVFEIPSELGEVQNTNQDLSNLVGKGLGLLNNQHSEKSDNPKSINIDSENKNVDFAGIGDFLYPASKAMLKIINEKSINNPELITQILSIKFSDLMTGFQQIFLESKSIEEACRVLFESVATLGVDKFLERVRLKSESDSQKDNISQEAETNNIDKAKDIVSILGEEKIEELISEYLETIQSFPNKQKIKIQRTMDLILQEVVGSDSTKSTPNEKDLDD